MNAAARLSLVQAAVRNPEASPWRHAWALALIALLAAVSWLAVGKFEPGPAIPGADKLKHLLAFGALAVPTGLLLARRAGRAWRVLALLLGYGIAIELVQSALPHRSAEALDLLADTLGVGLGLLILWRLEAWAGVPPAARR